MRDLQTGRGFHFRQPLERRTSSIMPVCKTRTTVSWPISSGGSYSVISADSRRRDHAGKAIVIGHREEVRAYTKLTGGQRVDMLAPPHICCRRFGKNWLTPASRAGMPTARPSARSKCAWARPGAALPWAIRSASPSASSLRYRGIRAPHKLKSAVSGCVRECAEAQSKDFGVIATEKGWNLYVCGNGGAQPRHADLLAADLDEDTCIRYIDRFLMYYIQTADRLTRTSKWLEAMEGGIDYLRDVIVNDRLQIADELERQAQFLVESYRCEWRRSSRTPSGGGCSASSSIPTKPSRESSSSPSGARSTRQAGQRTSCPSKPSTAARAGKRARLSKWLPAGTASAA